MTVKKLIEALEKMPKDVRVGVLWDGAVRSDVQFVWVANSGIVVLADGDEYTTYPEDFPVGFIGDRYTTPCCPKED